VYNLSVIRFVTISNVAQKQLRRVPEHVALKLQAWIAAVEVHGLEIVRRAPGFHDEPLRGKRTGQRSIRLSRAYRAIYQIEDKTLSIAFVQIKEVHKHDY
jgi:proteic killer suppression protein